MALVFWLGLLVFPLAQISAFFKPTNQVKLRSDRHKLNYGNSFGTMFKISTWGESHGNGVGVTIDGCPPNIPISVDEIQIDLDRRRPGQSYLTTSRKELDTVEILSGKGVLWTTMHSSYSLK